MLVSSTSPSGSSAGASRRTKIAAAIVGAVALAGVLASKAHEIFIEPSELLTEYIGIEPMDGAAPEFALEAHDGKSVQLSGFRGRFVLLNFWATWCDSCRVEMPSLARMAKSLHGTPLVVVAASVDDDWQPVDQFFGNEPAPFDVLRDPGSTWAQTFGTSKFPETYLIGPDGRLRAKLTGPRDWDDEAFELFFRKVLADSGAVPPRPAPP